MKTTSIKKVKFEGRPTRLLGGMNNEYAFEDNKGVLNKEGRKMVNGIIDWLRRDYQEHNDKIGTVTAQYYFEEFNIDLGKPIIEDGKKKGMHFDGTNMGGKCYELVLKIFVPLTGMSFAATDVHTYRYNIKYGEFQHESTEIQ